MTSLATHLEPSTSVVVARPPLPPIGRPRAERSWVRTAFDDLLYVLGGFPLTLLSFCVLVTLLSTAFGLVIVWVGVPLLLGTLVIGQGFAEVERRRLRARGEAVAAPVYPPARIDASWSARTRDRLADRQRWLDVLHGIVAFPLATVTWSIAVSWIASALAALSAPLWTPHATIDGRTVEQHLGGVEPLVRFVGLPLVGVILLITAVPVVWAMAASEAALARALLANDRVADLQAAMQRMRLQQVAAADVDVADRQRLERDIHDGPQQRLVRLGMDLAAAERRLDRDPSSARELVSAAREQANEALHELRNLSRGIAPPLLTDRGLVAALADLAERSRVPVAFETSLPSGERLPARVENALYFAAAEALTNVAKHAGATRATIRLDRVAGTPTRVVVAVTDNGVGGASLDKGHGLTGLRHRLEALEGSLLLDSPSGGPTVLLAEVPCAL
jgi:signal transduction histidine kinase